VARLKEKNHSSAFPRTAAVIWRGFGVCLVERMRLSLKALNGQALGLTSRHPRTAGSACRQLQESFVVGPLMAAPVWRLLRARSADL